MALRILLVEDDEPKRQQIVDFLLLSMNSQNLSIAKSLNSACRIVDDNSFDVIFLDMTLPTFDGGSTVSAAGRQKTLGGKEILRYLWESEIETQVFVVSQFKDFPADGNKVVGLEVLDRQLRSEFPTLYRDHVYFEHKSNAWKVRLSELLKEANENTNC